MFEVTFFILSFLDTLIKLLDSVVEVVYDFTSSVLPKAQVITLDYQLSDLDLLNFRGHVHQSNYGLLIFLVEECFDISLMLVDLVHSRD